HLNQKKNHFRDNHSTWHFEKTFHLNSPTNASASCTAVLVTLALMTSKSLIHNPYKKLLLNFIG
ncbi:MAG: hypothetical protein EZS28_027389, partial [Streblomastix strix]